MLILKLAYRNLIGAGLKTWLKVLVLSLCYVLIIWQNGFIEGMYRQATRAMIKDEIAGGQFWQEKYDPYDPFTLDDSHSVIPESLKIPPAAPILISQGSIFPGGRMQSVLLKGIEPGQTVLGIPTDKLNAAGTSLPLMIGGRMARDNSLKTGDYITIRWRDSKGTFDAAEGKIVCVMKTDVPTIDNGQIWLPIEKLGEMTGLKGQATIIVVAKNYSGDKDIPGWSFRDAVFLTSDVIHMVRAKRAQMLILYGILLFLAMIAIFDTQILSIFRRRKEIGTLIALGMTRLRVIMLFTLEGSLVGMLAALAGSVYGIPLIYLTAQKGIKLPEIIESYGYAISSTLYPVYTAGFVISTVVIIMITTTIVSYLPARNIAKLNPTEALKGKTS